MDPSKFPIFCGRVIKVGDQTEWRDELSGDITCVTEILYSPGIERVCDLEDVKVALVPLRLDASLVHDSEVKACFTDVVRPDGTPDKCYELEVIKLSRDSPLPSYYEGRKFKLFLSNFHSSRYS